MGRNRSSTPTKASLLAATKGVGPRATNPSRPVDREARTTATLASPSDLLRASN
ncbi:MAG: hypothetical protein AVDCRST_MAG19-4664 [uncultured Thermomicrobiales bacterium]|uniref:Uncharacterized protein n=1 Tax=uncultured Thermomicrobiales bacterium TaxID=1645740 RepID=A0A6J4VT26_9BACT|nr:MAG: hypothetical protein AVDCRST_MAG19-4664 [uncultured Thermomicrobiales bacterium]